MFQVFFKNRERSARPSALAMSGVTTRLDPLAHPDLAKMSMLQLADLPFAREETLEQAPAFAKKKPVPHECKTG